MIISLKMSSLKKLSYPHFLVFSFVFQFAFIFVKVQEGEEESTSNVHACIFVAYACIWGVNIAHACIYTYACIWCVNIACACICTYACIWCVNIACACICAYACVSRMNIACACICIYACFTCVNQALLFNTNVTKMYANCGLWNVCCSFSKVEIISSAFKWIIVLRSAIKVVDQT